MKKILWDIDGTLLNFDLAETAAIKECFRLFDLTIPSLEMIKDYKKINDGFWKKLERGEITREEVLVGRFENFFQKYGIDKGLSVDFNKKYQIELGKTYVFNPHAENLVIKLADLYDQYAVTNGSLTAQKGKLEGSKLSDILKNSFISEIIGYEKPDPKFFDYVFDKIGDKNLSNYIIIGDSLTSDMRGGINAGIKTIWFNPNNASNNLNLDIDYTINSLDEVEAILAKEFS